jgi:gas vesicle protein
MKSRDASSVIIAFVAGAAAGVAAGILLAPDKGQETRSRLKSKISDLERDLTSNFEGKFNDLKGYVTGLVSKGKDAAEQAQSAARKYGSQVTGAASSAADNYNA